MKSESIISVSRAGQLYRQLGKEFIVIKNPEYIHPSFEICPLAPRITAPVPKLSAAVMDMDGTTTTTEFLCISSLEKMVRLITNRPEKSTWAGLDPVTDYPFIIGNSTTKHVEFLVKKFLNAIQPEALKQAYFQAALWTLTYGQDEERRRAVIDNLVNLGCQGLLSDQAVRAFLKEKKNDSSRLSGLVTTCREKYGADFRMATTTDFVRAGIDIYYQCYHQILDQIKCGNSAELTLRYASDSAKNLIEPMPGIGEFLALVKGWLNTSIRDLVPGLRKYLAQTNPRAHVPDDIEQRLTALGRYFARHPLKIAVVTSSIFYEADVVMTEVMRILRQQINTWPIDDTQKALLRDKFSDYRQVYDAVVTASDSSEIRLKPHRDLYSLALHRLGIPKTKFNQVIGFEDSTSGTIAIRAAGIGLCIAVPFAATKHHDLRAAAFTVPAGLPEVLLSRELFLRR